MAGGLLALGPEGLRGRGRPDPGGPACWVAADRDGGELVLLDAGLLVVERRALPWPTHVRACPDGGLWAVSAREGHPGGAHELVRMDPVGVLEALHTVPPVLDLEVEPSGRAWLLVRVQTGRVEVWVTGGSAAPARYPAPPDARGLVLGGERRGVVSPAGGLLELDLDSGCWGRLAGPQEGALLDARPAREGGWWLLVRDGGSGGERVLRVGESGVRALRCPGAERLAGGRSGIEACWVVGDEGRWVRRLGPDLPGHGLFARPAAAGCRAATSDAAGGLVLAAGGALLRVRSDGSPAAGQGGFDHLSDLDRW